MDIASINALTSEWYPVLQALGAVTLALLAATVLSSMVVKRHRPENKKALNAVRTTGVLMTAAVFLTAAYVGIVDENASLELKDQSFAAAVKATYGENVIPGSGYGNFSYGVTSGEKSAKADFIVNGKLATVTVKEVGGKWLIFDAAGNELPRVTRA